MPVYERSLRVYAGPLTAARRRPLVLFRWAWREMLASRLVLLLLAAAAVSTLVFGILIYLRYNLAALAALRIDPGNLVPIDGRFFEIFLLVQAVIAFFVVLIAVPPLLSRDCVDHALPLYLSRPLSRRGYLMGKMLAPLALLSAVTWGPGLLLFALQASLAGGRWAGAHLNLAAGLFLGAWTCIGLLVLPAFAFAASLKRRLAASAALVGIVFIPGLVGGMINALFVTRWGSLLNFLDLMRTLWGGLFGLTVHHYAMVRGPEGGPMLAIAPSLPVWSAWLMALAVATISIAYLAAKLRAYEEVRG